MCIKQFMPLQCATSVGILPICPRKISEAMFESSEIQPKEVRTRDSHPLANIQSLYCHGSPSKGECINQFGDNVFFDKNAEKWAGATCHSGHFSSAANSDKELSIQEERIVWRKGKMVPTSVCSNVCPAGTRKAQIKGKPRCCFDCIPCADGTIANSTGRADCTPCTQEYWSNERKDECIPKIIEFLTYQEPMGMALTVVSLLGASLSLASMTVFIRFRETPVIKASNSELSCFLLFLSFCVFSVPSLSSADLQSGHACCATQLLV
ncbi:hypothetical protein F7725_020637 [Dissostichus mawsoni]|uniref:G-protein coupled receptors family 3 profile domain-containing protein n=1 Tax=Dissostichus mawsoni TaxID=36200 RepID=A0A7J5YFS2_DISMA|nr:hypothetical protein F7725_020637 [Dissostichus mawsoni]